MSIIPDSIQPEVINEVIDNYIKTIPTALTKSHNLSGDLKKINTNIASKIDSIDLSGCEKSPTKKELDNRLTNEQNTVEAPINLIEELEHFRVNNLSHLISYNTRKISAKTW